MKRLIKYLALFSLFIAFGIGSAIIVMKFTIRGEETIVPDLAGKDLVVAIQMVTRNGLNVKLERTEPDPAVPKNSIISQDPPAGRRVKRGRVIGVVVSQGTKEMAVANLMGQNIRYAGDLLKTQGLNIGETSWVNKEGASQGTIIAQSPAPSTLIEQGSKVDLLVSLGPRPRAYLMPDVTGQRSEEVQKLLKAFNLKIGNIIQEETVGLEPGVVIFQEPKAGMRVEEGQEVSLTVASYAPQVTDKGSATYALLYYQLPSSIPPSHLVVRVRNNLGEREIFNDQKKAGESISLLISVEGETVASIYLNGEMVQERRF